MPNFRTGSVTGVIDERQGLQKVSLEMADGKQARGYVLTELIGDVSVGDEVICNTTAVELSLGTGGWHFVHWNLSRSELDIAGPDHIMKMRYTSLQRDVGTSELLYPDAADREIGGTPVVVCSVHSQVAMVALGFAAASDGRRLAYVMTDGASLPLAVSDLVEALANRGLICGTVTAGHAFGGDLEAVTVAAALGLATHVLDADAIVVGMGPGVVGTGTEMGTTAIEVAGILDTVNKRGGNPILCLRASSGDPRPRHQGLSHHMEAILELTSTVPDVAQLCKITDGLIGVNPVALERIPDPAALLAQADLRVTTMGRDQTEDELFFEAATAAGILLAKQLSTESNAPTAPA